MLRDFRFHGPEFRAEKGSFLLLPGINGADKTAALEYIEGLRKYDDGNHLATYIR